MGTILITGGARRIGRYICEELASEGYNIAIHYNTSSQEAKDFALYLEKKYFIKAKLYQSDFYDISMAKTLIDKVTTDFSDLNALVNNASIFKRAFTKETDEELFDKHFNVNFKFPYFLTKYFASKCRDGNVVNILDTKITLNQQAYSSYILSKKSLTDFTLMAAKEFAPNIRVNGIAPGFILPPVGQEEYYEKLALKKVPLKKVGSPENISKSVQFLLGNDFITGQILFVDGGEHLGSDY